MTESPKTYSKKEIASVLANPKVGMVNSLKYFCVAILGLLFADHHQDWVNKAQSFRYLLVKCSRDFGKSWFWSYAYALWRMIVKPIDVCVISYSEDQVIKLTTHSKREIEQNPDLIDYKPKDNSDWTKTYLRLSNGSTLTGLSFGSAARGGHYDLIIVDDALKDFGGMNTEDQENYFFAVIVPMLKPNGQLIVVGTPNYSGDLLEVIEKNKLFITFDYPAIKEDGTSLWPERWSTEKLIERKNIIGSWRFAREYLLQRVSSEIAPLKESWLKYWHDSKELPQIYNTAIYIDPAISKEETADHTGIVIGQIDYANNLYLPEIVKQRLSPKELIELVFTLNNKWKPSVIGFESVGFQRVYKQWIMDESNRRGIVLPINDIPHNKQSKSQRIMSLQPRMESGKLFIHPTMLDLIDEIRKFRIEVDGSDDLLDALAGVTELLFIPNEPKQPKKESGSILQDRVNRFIENQNKPKNRHDEGWYD
jgi:predicted phage terminase large subunit-like protein